MALSQKALQLIFDFEGINQPGRWPGGGSGITIGYGYDLGYVTADEFDADWSGGFTPEQFSRLHEAIGKTGQAANALAPRLADIKCTLADSRRVLIERSIPKDEDKTRAAFPGFDNLPLDVQGALVSLVYNRGAGMKDAPGTDNRREMRAIRDCVAQGDLAGIAAQLRSMKRLWEGKGLDGLLRRRDAEAMLVQSCLAPAASRGVAAPLEIVVGAAPTKRRARKKPTKKAAAKKKAPTTKKAPAKKRVTRKRVAKKPRKPPVRKARAKKATAKKRARRIGRPR